VGEIKVSSRILKKIDEYPSKYWITLLSIIFILGFMVRIMPYAMHPGVVYGQYDAAYHYQASRLISLGDYPRDCPGCLDIKSQFGGYYYPPGFHTVTALLSIISFLPPEHVVFLASAFLDCMLILTVFLLIRELYGVTPALSSAAIVALSTRNILSVFWGQWPSFFGMSFIPLIILYGYRGLYRRRDMFTCGIICGLGFTVYPQWALHALGVVVLLHTINVKKIGFGETVTRLGFLIFPFMLISTPTYYFMKDYVEGRLIGFDGALDFNRFLSWYPPLTGLQESYGYPNHWFSLDIYSFAALLLFGVGVLGCFVCRHDMKFQVSALNLLVFYIFAHMDALGLASMDRVITHHHIEILVPALFVPCAYSIGRKKYGAIMRALIISLTLLYIISQSHSLVPLSSRVYPPETRLSSYGLEAALWMRENTPEVSTIKYLGALPDLNLKWFNAVSDRRIVDFRDDGSYYERVRIDVVKPDYIIFDYSTNFIKPGERNMHTIRMMDLERRMSNLTGEEVFVNDYIAVKKTR
jgi:asparagine N-glycosylation enzyme membrane subunit Stt3